MLTGLARTEFEKRLDVAVERFEQRCHADNLADVREFLPMPLTDEDRRIGLELLCVDLQYRWRRGLAKSVAEYQRDFPEWLGSQEAIRELAFEEYRMANAEGERPSPQTFSDRYRIDTSDWPTTASNQSQSTSTPPHSDSSSLQELVSLEWLEACDEFPNVGDCFEGFEIESELGRGAFAVVYLARQSDLANRQVALKISLGPSTEASHLARLVHTHIMPIHSVHRKGPFRILCMPFLGRDTLESHLRSRPGLPEASSSRGSHSTDSDRTLSPSTNTYVRWIRDLASGLEFAHQQHVVHSDLKPANILLAENGNPLLMDFNLAEDVSQQNRAYVIAGGTLPYLAPEHLRRLQSGGQADARTDLYSLGVILYQLLTGELPYPARRGAFDETIDQMVHDRQRPARWACELNPQVAPGLAAILQKLLAALPADRYASAAELIVDLDRHLNDLPLLHAENPSLRERLTKFSRRHPALTSGTAIGTLAFALLAASIFFSSLLVAKVRRLDTIDRLHIAQNQLQFLRAEMTDPLLDTRDRDLSWQKLHEQLVRCQLDSPTNSAERLARDLSEQEQVVWRDAMTQYLYLASLHWQRAAQSTTSPSDKQSALAQAARWNARASELVSQSRQPMTDAATVVRWQAERFSPKNDPLVTARRTMPASDAELSKLRDPAARLLAALASLSDQRYAEAAILLEPLRDATPHDPSIWLLLGNAYAGLERFEEAEVCYSVCIPMWPESYVGPFYRGLARLQKGQFQEAADDFSLALERSPKLTSAFMNRAAALTELKDYARAEADLTKAIELGATQSRLYLLRADLRRRLHRLADAEADLAEGLQRTPTDELSWVQRGLAQAKSNPQAALKDLKKALELNPTSRYALRNLAYVLGEQMNDLPSAMSYLDQLIQIHSHADDLISLAVYQARTHHRDEAVTNAQKALTKSRTSKVLFQTACVHAILRASDEPATQALAFLEEALAIDPQWVRLAGIDPDLQNIRNDPAFQQIVQAAQQRMMRQKTMSQIK